MTFSLASAGSPGVPRAAATWVRATALPAVSRALDDVSAARDAARTQLVGESGGAYAAHAGTLLAHLCALESRLRRVALLLDAYADRLVAHEILLHSVRSRAVAAGLPVVGDSVPPPAALVSSVTWSELASVVGRERSALLAWVQVELESAVASFADPDLTRWVIDFLDANRVGLAGAGLEVTADRGSRALATRGLLESADRLDRLAKVPGPAGLVHDTVTALESDDPAEALCLVGGGVALAALAPVLLPTASAVVLVGAATVLGHVGSRVAERLWDRIPDEAQDVLDDAVEEAWDGTKALVADTWDQADDAIDHLGDSLVDWAVR